MYSFRMKLRRSDRSRPGIPSPTFEWHLPDHNQTVLLRVRPSAGVRGRWTARAGGGGFTQAVVDDIWMNGYDVEILEHLSGAGGARGGPRQGDHLLRHLLEHGRSRRAGGALLHGRRPPRSASFRAVPGGLRSGQGHAPAHAQAGPVPDGGRQGAGAGGNLGQPALGPADGAVPEDLRQGRQAHPRRAGRELQGRLHPHGGGRIRYPYRWRLSRAPAGLAPGIHNTKPSGAAAGTHRRPSCSATRPCSRTA